jgi:predicted ribosome quality control (RQC) complex YloA/Tae2 family protein
MNIFNFNNKDYIIKIGSNKFNNWELLDCSEPKDILFHVSENSSSYIILHNIENLKLKEIPKQVIKRCACLCKSHSKSAKEKDVIINYTKIENCEKGEHVGSVYMNNIKSIKI